MEHANIIASKFGRGNGTVTDANDESFDAATAVDPVTNQITLTATGFVTGDAVKLSSLGTAPVGLIDDNQYFIILIDENTVQLAETEVLAYDGTAIDITADGAGVSTLLVRTAIDFPRYQIGGSIMVRAVTGKTMTVCYTLDIGAENVLWKDLITASAAGTITAIEFPAGIDAIEIFGVGDYSYGWD